MDPVSRKMKRRRALSLCRGNSDDNFPSQGPQFVDATVGWSWLDAVESSFDHPMGSSLFGERKYQNTVDRRKKIYQSNSSDRSRD